MKFNLEISSGNYIIKSYGVGEISVALLANSGAPDPALASQETLTRSLILLPRLLIRDWPPQVFEELTAVHFDIVAKLRPELMLLGCGARLRFPNSGLTSSLREQGAGLEVMDTGAACRTYNVLVAEGRNVAAALLMI